LPLDFYTGEVSRGGAFRLILIYENGKSVINNYFTEVVEANSIASANLSLYQPVFRTYATVSLGNVQGLEPKCPKPAWPGHFSNFRKKVYFWSYYKFSQKSEHRKGLEPFKAA